MKLLQLERTGQEPFQPASTSFPHSSSDASQTLNSNDFAFNNPSFLGINCNSGLKEENNVYANKLFHETDDPKVLELSNGTEQEIHNLLNNNADRRAGLEMIDSFGDPGMFSKNYDDEPMDNVSIQESYDSYGVNEAGRNLSGVPFMPYQINSNGHRESSVGILSPMIAAGTFQDDSQFDMFGVSYPTTNHHGQSYKNSNLPNMLSRISTSPTSQYNSPIGLYLGSPLESEYSFGGQPSSSGPISRRQSHIAGNLSNMHINASENHRRSTISASSPTDSYQKFIRKSMSASRRRRLINYELKVNCFLKRRYEITKEKIEKIEKIRKVLKDKNISITDKDLIVKHKGILAKYGSDWFEAVYYLGGIPCEVTDEQHAIIMKRLEQIASELSDSRSADVMFILYDILRDLNIKPYYNYTAKLTNTRKSYLEKI